MGRGRLAEWGFTSIHFNIIYSCLVTVHLLCRVCKHVHCSAAHPPTCPIFHLGASQSQLDGSRTEENLHCALQLQFVKSIYMFDSLMIISSCYLVFPPISKNQHWLSIAGVQIGELSCWRGGRRGGGDEELILILFLLNQITRETAGVRSNKGKN